MFIAIGVFITLAVVLRILFIWLFKKTGFKNAFFASLRFGMKTAVLSLICFGIAFAIFATPTFNGQIAIFPASFAMETGGFLLLGLMVFNIGFFILQTAILEKRSFWQSWPRSQAITNKNWLRLYLPHNLAFVFFFTFAIIAHAWNLTTEVNSAIIPIVFIFTSLGNVILTLFYYEYRARNENYGEELMAQELGYQPLQEMMSL